MPSPLRGQRFHLVRPEEPLRPSPSPPRYGDEGPSRLRLGVVAGTVLVSAVLWAAALGLAGWVLGWWR